MPHSIEIISFLSIKLLALKSEVKTVKKPSIFFRFVLYLKIYNP